MTTASCAGVTKQRDKMCLWSTAGTPNPPGQALPEALFSFVKSAVVYDTLLHLAAWPALHP